MMSAAHILLISAIQLSELVPPEFQNEVFLWTTSEGFSTGEAWQGYIT